MTHWGLYRLALRAVPCSKQQVKSTLPEEAVRKLVKEFDVTPERAALLAEIAAEQRKLPVPTDLGEELWRESMSLLKEKYTLTKPLRAAGLTLTELRPADRDRQLSLFTDENRRDRLRSLEKACDDIRERFGAGMVRRGCTLMDTELADPVYTAEHIPGPAGSFGGRKSMMDGSV